VLERCTTPATLDAVLGASNQRVLRPWLFHLMWSQDVLFDLDAPITRAPSSFGDSRLDT
jgi:hypothetical protein